MNKLKFLFVLGIFIFISMKYGSIVRGAFSQAMTSTISTYINVKTDIEDLIKEHFDQQTSIQKLRAENKELRSSVELLNVFAKKLNDLLDENDVKQINPKVKLVSSLAYANLNDYYKVWLDFKDYNSSKIYGLLYKGNSAGIVVQKDGNPLALLIGDPKSIFSVYVGNKKIPGVIVGKRKEVVVKYIPLWMKPKVGDEVITSGLDGIFEAGIGVGVVSKIIDEELSKTAIIKPYVKASVPLYYHVITN